MDACSVIDNEAVEVSDAEDGLMDSEVESGEELSDGEVNSDVEDEYMSPVAGLDDSQNITEVR